MNKRILEDPGIWRQSKALLKAMSSGCACLTTPCYRQYDRK